MKTEIELFENLYGEIYVRQNIRTANFPTTKILYGETSLQRNIITAKFPYIEFSHAEISGHVTDDNGSS